MDRADVVVPVVSWLDVVANSRVDLMNGSIRIGDACNSAGGVANLVQRAQQLRYDHSCFAASGAGREQHVLIATDGGLLLLSETHAPISQFAASTMYFGSTVA